MRKAASRGGAVAVAVAVALSGCGGGQASPRAQGKLYGAAQLSPAKRAYLAHFPRSCKGGDKLAAQSDRVLRTLLKRIAHGDRRAAAQLSAFLHRLAAAYLTGLVRTRRLGSPPDPGASSALTYFAEALRAAQLIDGIARAIDTNHAELIAPGTSALSAATRAAGQASRAYGFPQCGLVGTST